MCLGIPMKVVEVHGDRGMVEIGGVKREASFQLLENVKVGEYVLVHAGYAINKIDEEEAQETLDLLREIAIEMEKDDEVHR
jgi:hydrogenase expression/formation protein HypC